MRGNTRPSGFFGAPTGPGGIGARRQPSNTRQGELDAPRGAPALSRQASYDAGDDGDELPALPPLEDMDAVPAAPAAAAVMAPGLGPLAPVSLDPPARSEHGALPFDVEVEVNELVHDPELDEAVIAFANADFAACERTLQQLVGPGGARTQHAETWLALFDLYRATGQQQRFESLALDYAQQFGWSAPQWFSLPKLVADALVDERPRPARLSGDVGWICPEVLDSEAVARLRSQTLQLPLPWVLDWSHVQRVEPEAAMQLSAVLRRWAGQALEMQWIGGDRLFAVLADAAPTGVRDADPAFWLVRLDALQRRRPQHPRALAVGDQRRHDHVHGVQQVTFGHHVIHEEGLGDRARVGQAGGLDHDTVELEFALAALFGQIGQRGAQVLADRAAASRCSSG
jgi:hypothetical protein